MAMPLDIVIYDNGAALDVFPHSQSTSMLYSPELGGVSRALFVGADVLHVKHFPILEEFSMLLRSCVAVAVSMTLAGAALAANPNVRMSTSLGEVEIELYADKAPISR
jgi:hypothetical protein